MPRPIRPQRPGAVYHVTMRGNNRGDIFFVDDDRDRFLQALSTVRHRCGWKIHAYCLMTNHYHLLIQTPSPNIAEGMQWLNSAYAHQTNTLYGRIGHVFQRRYADGLITEDDHLRTVLRYIPLNPVNAGLSGRPEEWRWSSYAATLGLARRPRFLTVRWLLRHFAEDVDIARSRYRDWVEDCLTDTATSLTPDLGSIFRTTARSSDDSLKAARAAGFSVREIAVHLGVSETTLRRWLATAE